MDWMSDTPVQYVGAISHTPPGFNYHRDATHRMLELKKHIGKLGWFLKRDDEPGVFPWRHEHDRPFLPLTPDYRPTWDECQAYLNGKAITVYIGDIQLRRRVPIMALVKVSQKAYEYFTAHPLAVEWQLPDLFPVAEEGFLDYLMVFLRKLDRPINGFTLRGPGIDIVTSVSLFQAAETLGMTSFLETRILRKDLREHICTLMDQGLKCSSELDMLCDTFPPEDPVFLCLTKHLSAGTPGGSGLNQDVQKRVEELPALASAVKKVSKLEQVEEKFRTLKLT
ncbi:hypothetical protein P154DRAFT_582657 [Amniculicola lignicola CBS 123094]|uniref:Uncharacterized protein n=1 Tax=Amniculicola lignicola CBS 123094 TaxID=1392246 RepID=A0A6A5W362_9PLEO|nr:hypothetical protein P154DRAFT_582657 [Amniculicola lignicola CBS 123094]